MSYEVSDNAERRRGMKRIFWGFGSLELLWSLFPSRLTGEWLGLSRDIGYMADQLSLLCAIICIGIGCILHEIERNRRAMK